MILSENQVFLSRYLVKEEIGSGSFGKVYRVEDINKPKSYALKVDIAQKGNVYLESKTLTDLQGITGIPKLYKQGMEENFSYMIMELLGQNLNKLMKTYGGKFSLTTVIMCIKQIIQRIEKVHKKGYLHRDLKPHQILLGPTKKALYLTDFGLSRRFEVNSYHISFQNSCPRIGNATFSSLNNHGGVRQSRRDDLESIAYMTFYLYKGMLPWQCNRKLASSSKWQAIFQMKSSCKVEDLCKNCPKEFGVLLNYIRNLKFEEKPDYCYCTSLLDSISSREELNLNKFDWALGDNLNIGSKSLPLEKAEKGLGVGNKCEVVQVRRKRASRAKTVFGKGRKLPQREEIILGSDCLGRSVFDESTYNSLELTPRNIWPEFRDRKILMKPELGKTNCVIM